MAKADITAEQVRELLEYDAETGVFRWKVAPPRKPNFIGREAGSVQALGYRSIGLSGKQYFTHRLAWLYVNGEWPLNIDHINGDRLDNRIANLRSVSHRVNNENRRQAASGKKHSQFLGVHPVGSKTNPWGACIVVHGKKRHLGCFPTEESAYAAHVAAKRRLHEGCTI